MWRLVCIVRVGFRSSLTFCPVFCQATALLTGRCSQQNMNGFIVSLKKVSGQSDTVPKSSICVLGVLGKIQLTGTVKHVTDWNICVFICPKINSTVRVCLRWDAGQLMRVILCKNVL